MMDESDASKYILALLDEVPETPPPLADLLSRGQKARRAVLHRRAAIAGVSASIVLVAVITAALTVNNARPSPTDRNPNPDGATQVVRQWRLTIQDAGFIEACALMTEQFQRASPYGCGNSNLSDSPPFLLRDYSKAEYRLLSATGDSATVQVSFMDGDSAPEVVRAQFNRATGRWLVAGPGVAAAAESLEGTWTVTALVDADGQSALIESAPEPPTVSFADGELLARTGVCNTINGRYEQNGADITIATQTLRTTLAGCTEPPLIILLPDAQHVSGTGTTRYLHASDWRIIAELRAE